MKPSVLIDKDFFLNCELETIKFLHFREDVVQLWSRADVTQEHAVNLWSEVLLGDGVILQMTAAAGSHE